MYYNICGLPVELAPEYPLLTRRAEKYRVAQNNIQQPVISVSLTKKEIEEHMRSYSLSSPELAEYVLYGTKFYDEILDFDGFFLHSSAVAYKNEAYLFTAPCGGGKSTHARLWRQVLAGCTAINDDKPVIRNINGRFYACGTPFSGKRDLNSNVIVPLKSVSVLTKAAQNSIKRIDPLSAAPLLLEQTLRTLSTERAQRLLALFDELLLNIPVYSLCCNTRPEAVYTAYSAMSAPYLEN